jgi:NAD(P)H-hydrate epimerase
VTIASPSSIERGFLARLPEAMTRPLPDADGALSPESTDAIDELLSRSDAVGIGPGLGTGRGAAAAVSAVIASRIPAVFDADALNLHAGEPEAFRRRRTPTILTPHPGEAGRLLGISAREVERDRPRAAAELARRSRAVVVLKGAPTLTADPSGMLWCNSSGSPALAKGGTGDVLTGVVASLLGQGFEPSDAAVSAAFVHGLAGEAAGRAEGERGALASEVANSIGRAIEALEG